MTDKWIIQEIEKQLTRQHRVVIIDPSGQSSYLLPLIIDKSFVILKTDSGKVEEWERVQEELMLRYDTEQNHKDDNVVFYVTRPREKLSFLFDYCYTHGCIDLTNPTEWLRKKLFSQTGQQVMLDNPMLLTAAKLGIGKDLNWWVKILQNLEDPVSIEDELIPFLASPERYFKGKEADVRRLFEEKLYELIGQAYRKAPPKTLANEVATYLLNCLLNNDISQELLSVYHKWLDSNTYSKALEDYAEKFKFDPDLNIWNVHPDHCFTAIDVKQLQEITANLRDKSYVQERMQKLQKRIRSRKALHFLPEWWQDLIVLLEFDNRPLALCTSLHMVADFYTGSFHLVDRAIRNLYCQFLHEEHIIRPLQEFFECLNNELLEKWYAFSGQYSTDQQGYMPNLIKRSKPNIAIIVGDGLRYEIAAYVAKRLEKKCSVSLQYMFADMPSETMHNMSALYVGNGEVIPQHKEREKKLSALTGKDIAYINLEQLNHGHKADYLVLTYKDIDSAGEKMQLGAIKLFKEFENVLIEKIQLLLNVGYSEVHLITDHGFVLTGLLDEADKVEPNVTGKKEVHERYVRTYEKQSGQDWIVFERPDGVYNYVYAAKTHRPFKSKGLYGFSHGGFTPQEILIPNFVFSPVSKEKSGLQIIISNKKELGEVTGELFGVKLKAAGNAGDLFAASRKVQVLLYANNVAFSKSNIINIAADSVHSLEFSFSGNSEITAVIVDAETQEQIDSVQVKKSGSRDLGGLL